MSLDRELSVTWQDAREAGGCNACGARAVMLTQGMRYTERVLVVQARSMSTRLCPECVKVLRKLLREAKP